MGTFSEIKKIVPTQFQNDIIFGSLLGDMGVYKRKNYANYNMNICHSIKQKDYFIWKFESLQPYFHKYREYYRSDKNTTEYCSDSLTLPFLEDYANWFYKDKVKFIPTNLYDKLSSLSLAVWFMDDGTTKKQDKLASIATMCFSDDDQLFICDVLKKKFDIQSHIKIEHRKNGKIYKQINFTRSNSIKLFNVISEHIIDSMKYKILF